MSRQAKNSLSGGLIRLAKGFLALVQALSIRWHTFHSWIMGQYAKNDVQANVFVGLRVVFLVAALTMFFRVPSPGFAVALLAVVAACMSLHEHQSSSDKATWVFLVVLLLGVEARSILGAKREENDRLTRSRADQEREFLTLRNEQNNSFMATMSGIDQSITQSQRHFNKTIEAANALLEKSDDLQRQSRENLNATTGGDSFAYMLYTPWGVSPFLKQNGKYPLHDLSVQMGVTYLTPLTYSRL